MRLRISSCSASKGGSPRVATNTPMSRRPSPDRRATLLSPLANALVLVGFSGALAWEAIGRFGAPPQVPGLPVMAVTAIGIGVNLGAAWLVRDGHAHDLNRRGAFLHLMADAAVSLAAVLAGAGMVWLGWSWLDPATALVVGAVIAVASPPTPRVVASTSGASQRARRSGDEGGAKRMRAV